MDTVITSRPGAKRKLQDLHLHEEEEAQGVLQDINQFETIRRTQHPESSEPSFSLPLNKEEVPKWNSDCLQRIRQRAERNAAAREKQRLQALNVQQQKAEDEYEQADLSANWRDLHPVFSELSYFSVQSMIAKELAHWKTEQVQWIKQQLKEDTMTQDAQDVLQQIEQFENNKILLQLVSTGPDSSSTLPQTEKEATQWASEYVRMIQKRLENETRARKERENRRKCALIQQLQAQQKQVEVLRDQQLLGWLMRQSQQEKQIIEQLMQIRKHKDVVHQNRIDRDRELEEQRLRELEAAREREEARLRQAQKKRKEDICKELELLEQLTFEHNQEIFRQYCNTCFEVLDGILEIAAKVEDYCLLVDNPIPLRLMKDLKELFISETPVYEQKEEGTTAAAELAVKLEKLSILDEQDYYAYTTMTGEWEWDQEDKSPPSPNDILYLVLSRMWNILNPFESSRPLPFYSHFSLRACVLGKIYSGKSTCLARISEDHGIHILSTESLIQNQLEELQAPEEMPDQQLVEIFVDAIRQIPPGQGWVLEGFPKTLTQALLLEKALRGTDLNQVENKTWIERFNFAVDREDPEGPSPSSPVLNLVVLLEVSNEEVLERAIPHPVRGQIPDIIISEEVRKTDTIIREEVRKTDIIIIKEDMTETEEQADDPEQTDDPEQGEVYEQVDDPEQGEVHEQVDDPEQGEVYEQVDDPEQGEIYEQVDDPEQAEVCEQVDVSEQADVCEQADISEQADGPEQDHDPEQTEVSEQADDPEDTSIAQMQIPKRIMAFQESWPDLEEWFGAQQILVKVNADVDEETLLQTMERMLLEAMTVEKAEKGEEEEEEVEEDKKEEAISQIEDAAVQTEELTLQTEEPTIHTEEPTNQTVDPAIHSVDPASQTEEPSIQTEEPTTRTETISSESEQIEDAKDLEEMLGSSLTPLDETLPSTETSTDFILLDLPLPKEVPEHLVLCWERLCISYKSDIKSTLQKMRSERVHIMNHLYNIREDFKQFLQVPSQIQELACAWQEELKANEDVENVEPSEVEPYQRLNDLQEQLKEVCHKEKAVAVQEKERLIKDWLKDHSVVLVSHCTSLIQVEVNRFYDTLHLLRDYYSGMNSSVFPEIAPNFICRALLPVAEDSEENPEEPQRAPQIGPPSFQETDERVVQQICQTALTAITNTVSAELKLLEDEEKKKEEDRRREEEQRQKEEEKKKKEDDKKKKKDAPPPKASAKDKKKGGKHSDPTTPEPTTPPPQLSPVPPTEEELEMMAKREVNNKIRQEYTIALQKEDDDAKQRLEMVKLRSLSVMQNLQRLSELTNADLEEWLDERFLSGMSSIDQLTEVLQNHIASTVQTSEEPAAASSEVTEEDAD